MSDRRALLRYAVTALVLLVIGGLFVQRELLSGGGNVTAPAGGDGTGQSTGMLAGGPVEVNQPAPDFALRDLDGKVVRLSDFRGKTVVLNFWATWCPPCRAEMPDLEATYRQRLPQGDFVVLAVDRLTEDSAGAVRSFAVEFGLTFPLLLDATGAVGSHYGVRGLPSSFFIDRHGVLRAQILGPVLGELLPRGIAAADAAGGS